MGGEQASELRVVRATGDPVERGRQIGRSLGSQIERSMAFYREYFERRGVAPSALQGLLAPYLGAAEARLPDHASMIRGMAEGAMVPIWELFAVNAFEELEPLLGRSGASRLDRCSTFAVSGPGFTLLGHNEQWLAGDAGNVAVVIETPRNHNPAIASPTLVCCLPAVGMNAHHGAQGVQSLAAADDRPGVPRVFVSRSSLESSDRMDAVRRTALEGRSGGYGYVFAFAGGEAFIVETSATRQSVLSGPGPHTNHYLDQELAELAPPVSPGSASRYDRLLQLLEERRPDSPEGVMDVLRDHQGAPQAICLHPDARLGDEAQAVLFSMVCDVEAGRMWVASGTPCTTPYEEVDLAGVTG